MGTKPWKGPQEAAGCLWRADFITPGVGVLLQGQGLVSVLRDRLDGVANGLRRQTPLPSRSPRRRSEWRSVRKLGEV